MDTAKAEVLAFAAFPRAHWRKIWSTNPIERTNKEIKRRSRVTFSRRPPRCPTGSDRGALPGLLPSSRLMRRVDLFADQVKAGERGRCLA